MNIAPTFIRCHPSSWRNDFVNCTRPPYLQQFQASGLGRGFPTPLFPYVWIEGDGEAYIASNDGEPSRYQLSPNEILVAIASPPGEPVRGFLFYPLANRKEGFARLPFEIESEEFSPVAREDFLQIKANNYKRLASGEFTGGAWFRIAFLTEFKPGLIEIGGSI